MKGALIKAETIALLEEIPWVVTRREQPAAEANVFSVVGFVWQ